MDAKSQIKVTDAGFTIIRKDDQPSPRIKFKNKGTSDWRTLSKHDTKADRDRCFEGHLQNEKTITD